MCPRNSAELDSKECEMKFKTKALTPFLFGNKKVIAFSLCLAAVPIIISLILGAPPLLEYAESDKETILAYQCLITASYPDAVCSFILTEGFWRPFLYDAGETGSSAPMNPKWYTLTNWGPYYDFICFFLVWQLTLSPIFRFGSLALGRLRCKKEVTH